MNYYLCGPVDFDKDNSWKSELKKLCRADNNILFFDPNTYSFGKITDKISTYIYNVNMSAIDCADVLVARWMSGQVSVGTPIELYYAIEHKKEIIFITDMVETSVYINYIAARCTCVVNTLDRAYGEILKLEGKTCQTHR